MKRLAAFLLLISHMNTSMFLPQVPQHDVFDEEGNQIDDINSVVEYVLVTLGLDEVADDEDNDNGQNFNIVKLAPSTIPPNSTLVNKSIQLNKDICYSLSSNSAISLMAYEVIIPPPKKIIS